MSRRNPLAFLFISAVCVLSTPVFASASNMPAMDHSYKGVNDTLWTNSESLKKVANSRSKRQVPQYTLNLDMPARNRWDHIAPDFVQYMQDVIEYLKDNVPAYLLPFAEKVATKIEPYFSDYGDEMLGLADALNMDVGDIVIVNLIYQVERIGVNCSNWNSTGPTIPDDPGCMKVDPSQDFCYCKSSVLEEAGVVAEDNFVTGEQIRTIRSFRKNKFLQQHKEEGDMHVTDESKHVVGGPGLCTSVVAESTDGVIYHGRNLDWNLPNELRNLAVDVHFQRNNKTIFTGTTLVGFVGTLNAIRPGGYSTSQNARGKGGKIPLNILEALLFHGMTPAQHIRKTFETTGPTFKAAVDALSSGPLIDECYLIVAGNGHNEGAIISRSRAGASDVWALNTTESFFRLQTNYDHWNPVPVADDRRHPGIKNMEAMGQANLTIANMWNVLETWPTFNHHTDYTGVYIPHNNTYQSYIWLDN